MQSNTSTSPAAPTSESLEALFADLKAADQAIRSAVRRAGALASSGVCERVEGGSLEWAIGMVCRLTGADRRMIVAAGETLRDLPTIDRLWADGLISWSQIRSIVLAVRRMPVSVRADVDARIAASADLYGGIDAFDPDHLVEAVDRAVDDLRDGRTVERREQRQLAANFVSVQPSFDGRVRGFFDYDPVNGAIVLNGFDAASPRPVATPDHEPGAPTNRGRQYAEGLVEMAREYLSGVNSGGVDPDTGQTRAKRRARPLFLGHVDVCDVSRGEGATLELNVRGRMSRISLAMLELLSQDADMQAVLFDAARPLAVSKKLRADKIPDDIRLAVRARDMGDRFPGSQSPLGHTELHHFVHREHGGTNDVDNLGCFTRDNHLNKLHAHGWRVRLDSRTGALTIKRRGRTWRSLPRSTGLARAPDHAGPMNRRSSRDEGRAPPAMDVANEPLPF